METSYKKVLITFVLLMIIVFTNTNVSGQTLNQSANYNLNTQINGNQIYEGRDYIELLPGFTNLSTSGNSLVARINNSIVVPTTQNLNSNTETPISPATALDQSLAVGTLAGNFNVSLNGAGSYNVPIALPPGTANMAPKLSVAYNSNAGDGFMGVGWNIAGLSAISRVSKNLFYDNVNLPVQFSVQDVFSLDGNRIVAGTTAGHFRTSDETFSDISILASNSNGPTAFSVATKEGITIEYGNTADSKQTLSYDATKIIAYYIDKVTDKFGNYYTYTYTNNAATGEFRIKQIDYTSNDNANISSCNTVYFIYEQKPDANINNKYYLGSLIADNVLLTEIRISSEGSVFHKYDFTYSSIGDTYIHLISMQEFGDDGVPYNKTLFNWNNLSSVTPTTVNGDLQAIDASTDIITDCFFGDYNGDGKTDLGIEAGYTMRAYNWPVVENGFILTDNVGMDNNGLNFSLQSSFNTGTVRYPMDAYANNMPLVYSCSTVNIGTLGQQSPSQYEDQIMQGNITLNTVRNTDGTYSRTIMHSGPLNMPRVTSVGITGSSVNFNSDKYEDAVLTREICTSTPPNEETDPNYLVDQNLFIADPYNSSFWVTTKLFIPTITLRNTAPETGLPYSYFQSMDSYAVALNPKDEAFPYDFDGDGLTDLVVIKDAANNNNIEECDVYYSTFINGVAAPFSRKVAYNLPGVSAFQGLTYTGYDYELNPSYKIYPLDVNGDKYLDLIIDNVIYVFNPVSQTFSKYNLPTSSFADPTTALGELRIGDFNGDGNSDFMYSIPHHGYIQPMLFLSMGKPDAQGVNWLFNIVDLTSSPIVQDALDINGGVSSPSPINQYYFQDFNNDGKTDILEQYSSGTDYSVDYFKIYYNVDFATGKFIESKPIAVQDNFASDQNIVDNRSLPYFGDFNGDGYTDIFLKNGEWTEPPTIIYFQNNSTNNIKSISNGLNQITNVTYASGSYTNPNDLTNTAVDQTDNTLAIGVISAVSQSNGIGGMNETDYSYAGSKINRAGNGFLGFTTVTEDHNIGEHADNTNSSVKDKTISESVSNFDYNNKFFYPRLTSKSLSYKVTTNSTTPAQYYVYPISNSTYTTSIFDYQNGVHFFPYLSRDVSTNYFYPNAITTGSGTAAGTPVTTTTTYSYPEDNANLGSSNSFGNLSSVNSTNGLNTSTVNYNNYGQYGSWCPNKPALVQKIQSRTGQTGQDELDVNYNWDPTTGKLISSSSSPGAGNASAAVPATAQTINTEYSYYTTGNIQQTAVTGSDVPASQITSVVYDPKQRFVINTTNAEGLITSATYEPNYGNVLTSTDANGLTAAYTYDGFGRLTQAVSPTGEKTTNTISWISSSSPDAGFNRLYYTTTLARNGNSAPAISYYDLLGRSVGAKTFGYGNIAITSNTYYNQYGQTAQSRSSGPNTNRIVSENTYDALGRMSITKTFTTGLADPSALTYLGGSTGLSPSNSLAYTYNGLSLTTTDINGRQSSKTIDNSGLASTITDAMGNTINYTYNNSNKPITIIAAGATTNITYDKYGRQYQLIDPDAGTSTFTYSSLNQLSHQQDNNGNTYDLAYDRLNRMTQKVETPAGDGPSTYNYVYDIQPNGKGEIASINGGPNNLTSAYTYDNYSRNNSVSETIDGQTFTTSYSFDNYSRVNKITYANGFVVNQVYDDYSNQVKSITDALNTNIWTLSGVNNLGMPQRSVLGGNQQFIKQNTLTDLMMPASNEFSIAGSTIAWDNLWSYVFDPTTGNMTSRQNILTQTGSTSVVTPRNMTEAFTYDNLDRLQTITPNVATANPMNMSYDGTGSIQTKSDIAGNTENYTTSTTTAPVHALQMLGPLYSIETETYNPLQNITYTPFNKIAQIQEGEASLTTDFTQLNYTYGLDNERRKMVEQTTAAGVLTLSRTKYYSSCYEKETITAGTTITNHEVNYIFAPDGLAAINETKNGVNTMYFASSDNLGSINMLVNSNGTVAADLSYDAWGRRRNAQDWSNNNLTACTITDRGYCGHEHLDAFNLINMNGRAYDPIVGQFISPDPVVQAPFNTQSYNRYAYCFNNPLRATDPTGYDDIDEDQTLNTDEWIDYSNDDWMSTLSGDDPGVPPHSCTYRTEPVAGYYSNTDQSGSTSGNPSTVCDYNGYSSSTDGWHGGPIDIQSLTTPDAPPTIASSTATIPMDPAGLIQGSNSYILPTSPPQICEIPQSAASSSATLSAKGDYVDNNGNVTPIVSNNTSIISITAGSIGLCGDAVTYIKGTFRLAKSGIFSPKFYPTNWTGNQYVNTYSLSNFGRGISTGANAFIVATSIIDISKGKADFLTYSDASFGAAGLTNSIYYYLSGTEIPGVGEAVGVYGVFRVTWDVGNSLIYRYIR